MPLDVQDRDLANRLARDREPVREEEPSTDARMDFPPVRERPPQERRPAGDLPREREEGLERDDEKSGERRKGLLRGHPVGFAAGLTAATA